MKDRIKKTSKRIMFWGLLAAMLLIPTFILTPNFMRKHKLVAERNDAYIPMEHVKDHTVDMLILGDSLGYSSISPLNLWKDHGFTSYNNCVPGVKMSEVVNLLESDLETQSPKIVVLESNTLFRKEKNEDEKEDVSTWIANKFYQRAPGLKFHDVWKSPILKTSVDNYLGFPLSFEVRPSKQDFPHSTQGSGIEEANEQNFEKMVRICQEKGIKLVVYSAPSIKCYNEKKVAAAEALCAKYGVDYHDMNGIEDRLQIDWQADTRDRGDHMNYFGANKVTHYMGDVLDGMKILPDRREDQTVAEDWNKMLNHYDQTIQKKGF